MTQNSRAVKYLFYLHAELTVSDYNEMVSSEPSRKVCTYVWILSLGGKLRAGE